MGKLGDQSREITESREILCEALNRINGGLKTYGVFKPETDKRDMYKEIEEELLDVINYSIMQIRKIRYMKEKHNL